MTDINLDKLREQAIDLRALHHSLDGLSADKIDGIYFRALVSAIGAHANMLEALLPAPTPRTLADMTPSEREACRWMKVEVYGVPCELGVIIYLTEYHATVMWHDGTTTLRDHKELTPLPDLPRLEWPASDPVAEDTPEPEQPQPEDVPEGEPWLIWVNGRESVAFRCERGIGGGDWIVHSEEYGHGYWRSSEVALLRRLVPERAPAPTHPDRMVTAEDYDNAPDGTVVWGQSRASEGNTAIEKWDGDWHETGVDDTYRGYNMEDYGPHEVIRRGDAS